MQAIEQAPQGPEGRSNVTRIVYASKALVQGSVYSEMERIRASAVRHNEPVGVYTALLHQSGWFLQWKEGPVDAVRRIMDRVGTDPRHCGLRMVHASRGPRLLDGPWSMAIVKCADEPEEMAQRVEEVRHAMDRGLQYSPPAVWRRLSTPMRHPGAARQAEPDAFQRLMVCSAVGQASFDLVRWLGQRHAAEVVHRRFAGPEDLDIGTDYVDFHHGERVLRVIAMARRGLRLPLTRAFIPDYSHVVLLLSGDPERDHSLLRKVADACGALVHPPTLLAVASDAAHHEGAAILARRLGLAYCGVISDPWDLQATWQVIEPALAVWHEAANSGSPMAPLRMVS